MSRSYVPPRGADGKILLPGSGFQALLDQSMQDVAPTSPAAQDEAPPVPSPPRARVAALVAGLLIAVALVALVRGLTSPPPAAVVPAASPVPMSETQRPTQPVTESARGLRRAVVAYAAPGGDLIGAIEAGRAYTPTGTFGADWLQIDVTGSGAVWVRASELPGAAVAALPDLQPPTPLPTATDVPAPVVVYTPPTPIPPPTVCAVAVAGDTSEQRCGYDLAALAADAQQALLARIGARAVSVTTATPLVLPTPVAPPAQTIR